MKVRSGQYRHDLLFYEKVPVDDGEGGSETYWLLVSRQPGLIEPMKSQEQMRYMQLNSAVTHKGECRYPGNAATITTAHLMVWNYRAFGIRSVINDEERDRKLTFVFEEQPNLDTRNFPPYLRGETGIASGETFGTGGTFA